MISKPRKYNLDLIFYIKPNSIWNFNLIYSRPVALSIGRDRLSIDHSSAHELMEATMKRAAEAGGHGQAVDFKELLWMEPDSGPPTWAT
ncbi:hypothetical protein GWG67_33205 [Bradyrhizobium sp. CSS354]|jgi:hypothetical protein|nr:hypothetical protein [Bradyrhizobium sp. CSS354]